MLKTPQPRVFTPEQFTAVHQSSSQQTGYIEIPKTIDPNFPTFEVPVNKKVLVYVPNFTIDTGNGSEMLMDKGVFHNITVGRSYYTRRCYAGLVVEGTDYDGSCPYCDCVNECWELFNAEWEQTCLQQGVALDDSADPLKEERKKLLKKMAIVKAEMYLTFPIIVFECDEKKKNLTPKIEDNNFVAQTYWYSIREKTYTDIWVKSFEGIESEEEEGSEEGAEGAEEGIDVVTHPAGRWFVLDYTYTPSKQGEQHNKRDSARALKVTHKTMKNYRKYNKQLDESAREWTPEKATQTVIANFYTTIAEAKETADEVMKQTRDRLTIIKSAKASVGGQNMQNLNNANVGQIGAGASTGTSPENILSNFGASPVGGANANNGVNTDVMNTGGGNGASPAQVTIGQ